MLMSPRSMPREPRLPQIFFGRDSELAEIIHMIFTNLGSRPARIAILGPGGYGKSTLANAVLTHERVQEHFGDARYFVACESIFSSGALVIELAKTLGVFDGATDAIWSRISTMLNSKDCIICLDNFESPWDQDADTRTSVEELLSRIAETRRTTLLITMRGTVRPAQTQWTMPFLPPLITLDSDAARQLWEHTADNYDKFAEELTKAVDYVPLAVSLLAHLAQATTPQLLLKQWGIKQTEFIYTGQANKQFNLEYSIQISIESGRMRANSSAKELLGVLSMLPDGMHIKQVERFMTILSEIDILSGICTLQECGIMSVIGETYQTHPIIRNFCKNHTLLSQRHKNALIDFYINLASTRFDKANANSYNEMILEVNNTKAMLSKLLKSDFEDYEKLVQALNEFIEFQCSIGDFSDRLISQTIEHLQQINGSTSLIIDCLSIWGRIYYYADNFENAKVKLQEAEMLCKTTKENESSKHAKILNLLGEIYLLQHAYNDAKISFENALKLYKLANNMIGQANTHDGLGMSYMYLNELNQAKASIQKALELNNLANDALGQGSNYNGLGKIYLKLNELDKAEVSFQKALELFKLSNAILSQGNALQGLGRVQMMRLQLQNAKILFENALAMHKQAQDAIGQKNDQYYLDKVLHKMSQL
jgi:tetratricopeptide (TPR) repeat protein